MPTNPNEPLSVQEKATFGPNAQRHPITGIPLESGSGALQPKKQAYLHLQVIAHVEGAAVAAEVRKNLDAFYAAPAAAAPPQPQAAPVPRAPVELPRVPPFSAAQLVSAATRKEADELQASKPGTVQRLGTGEGR